MPKILFINQPSPFKLPVIRDINRSGRVSKEGMIWPQTSLAQLAGMVVDIADVKILDCIAEGIGWDKALKIISDYNPDILVGNVISSTLDNDLLLFVIGKFLRTHTIATGPHITALPEDTLERCSFIDYGILGEAEETLKELTMKLIAKEDTSTIKGIARKSLHNVIINPKRDFMKLSDLAPTPHQMLPLNKYYMPFLGKTSFIITSRGCPYNCTFCRQNVMWEGVVRYKHHWQVLDEIRTLKILGVENIMFHTDTFTANRQWVMDLCTVLKGLDIRWCCNAHINSIDEELAIAMKEAGCWMMAIGIESGNQEILDRCNKHTRIMDIEKKIHMLNRVGMEVWGYFMFGLLGETKETVEQTIDFSLRLPLSMANYSIASPYPGTPFYKEAKALGYIRTEDWTQYDQNYSSVVEYPNLSSKDLENALLRANLRFFLRWRPFKKLLLEYGKPRHWKRLWRLLWAYLIWKGK